MLSNMEKYNEFIKTDLLPLVKTLDISTAETVSEYQIFFKYNSINYQLSIIKGFQEEPKNFILYEINYGVPLVINYENMLELFAEINMDKNIKYIKENEIAKDIFQSLFEK